MPDPVPPSLRGAAKKVPHSCGIFRRPGHLPVELDEVRLVRLAHFVHGAVQGEIAARSTATAAATGQLVLKNIASVKTSQLMGKSQEALLNPIGEALAKCIEKAESKVKPFVTERIGPRPYQIGGLKASQGGVALKISRAGKNPFEAYSVFTGYPG